MDNVLTKTQEDLCDSVYQEYIDDLLVPRKPNKTIIKKWLAVAYKLYDLPVPDRLEIADSPEAALKLASDLTGEKQTAMDWCGVGDGGWVAFLDFFHRAGLDDGDAEVFALRDFGRVAWDSVLLDECAIVIRRPVELHVDEEGNLHSTTGPCIRWSDGEQDFSWHGQWVPERMIVAPKAFTRDEFLAITNTEERRALGEIAGWEWIINLLGATCVDVWSDTKTKLSYELLECHTGKFLRKQSPKLKSGAQPTYVEPVHEDLRTASGARKWQATRLEPSACDRDPSLSYSVES